MPAISRFFGITILMYYNDHAPPHFHADYQGESASFHLTGTPYEGHIHSRTARQLIADWAGLHPTELHEDWELARAGLPLNQIPPLE